MKTQFAKKDQGDFAYLPFSGHPGFLDEMRQLLKNGMPVDARHRKDTALLVALSSARWDAAHLLLDHGADPMERTARLTALHQAVRSRTIDTDLVQRLIDAGINIDDHDNQWGWTPLAIAETPQAVVSLLGAGANPNIRVQRKNSSKSYSILCPHARLGQNMLMLLAAGCEWPADPYELEEILGEFTELTGVKASKLVAEYGLPVDRLWGDDRPIDWAVRTKDDRLLSMLRQEGPSRGAEVDE